MCHLKNIPSNNNNWSSLVSQSSYSPEMRRETVMAKMEQEVEDTVAKRQTQGELEVPKKEIKTQAN